MSERIVKIGNVELYESEVQKLYEEKKYIVSYSGVYQIFYSNAQKQFYGQKVIEQKGIAARGRFYTMKADAINNVIGEKILIEQTEV